MNATENLLTTDEAHALDCLRKAGTKNQKMLFIRLYSAIPQGRFTKAFNALVKRGVISTEHRKRICTAKRGGMGRAARWIEYSVANA